MEVGVFQRAWKFAQDASGCLWIAFRSGRSRTAIGRYDPSCVNSSTRLMWSAEFEGSRRSCGIRRGICVWTAKAGCG